MTVQSGNVSASVWMDRKTVMVVVPSAGRSGTEAPLRYLAQPPSSTTTSSWVELTEGINGVGTTRCRSKSRKFYKYIFFFLFNVAITNAFILLKSSGSCPFMDLKSFPLQLAKDLVGEYCSRRRRGRGGSVIHQLPFRHFPIRLDNSDGPCRPHVPCALHRDTNHRRVASTWYCMECDEWLCHTGDADDCFMRWHARRHIRLSIFTITVHCFTLVITITIHYFTHVILLCLPYVYF